MAIWIVKVAEPGSNILSDPHAVNLLKCIPHFEKSGCVLSDPEKC